MTQDNQEKPLRKKSMLIPSNNNSSNPQGSAVVNINNYKRSNSLLIPGKAGTKKTEPHFNYSAQKKKTAPTKFGDTTSDSSDDLTPNSQGKPKTNSTTGGMTFGSRAKQ